MEYFLVVPILYWLWQPLRTGETLSVRIVGGKPGSLIPATVNWAFSQRTFTIEWLEEAI